MVNDHFDLSFIDYPPYPPNRTAEVKGLFERCRGFALSTLSPGIHPVRKPFQDIVDPKGSPKGYYYGVSSKVPAESKPIMGKLIFVEVPDPLPADTYYDPEKGLLTHVDPQTGQRRISYIKRARPIAFDEVHHALTGGPAFGRYQTRSHQVMNGLHTTMRKGRVTYDFEHAPFSPGLFSFTGLVYPPLQYGLGIHSFWQTFIDHQGD